MAATDANFDADAFIEGIHFAMSLGLPALEADRPTFHFKPTTTYTVPVDDDGVPFDPTATPTIVSVPTIKVACAVEYVDAEGKVENWGIIVPAKVKLTFLQQDYALIEGFDWVVIGPNRYFYRKTHPPLAMDSVGVWTIECNAEDQG